jgi:hypothetical protein
MAGQWAPVIAPPAPSGPSFNMTAGSAFDFYYGYSNGAGDLPLTFGSIDVEPFPGNELIVFLGGGFQVVQFDGDIVALLSGLTVWVNGVEYPDSFTGWSLVSGRTEGSWVNEESGPAFADGNTYLVELK